ncbi:MAG: hypothetical protein AB1773_06785 [Pseudomonadota bacterium]
MKPMRETVKKAGRGASRLALVAVFGIAVSGCSLLSEYRIIERDVLRNPDGHIVGQKETLRYRGTGEVLTRLSLYAPWRNAEGQIVGYEERTRSGSIIRDLQGNVIGGRWKDLRSRGTNMYNEGISVVFMQPAPRRGAGSELQPVAALDFVRLAERL